MLPVWFPVVVFPAATIFFLLSCWIANRRLARPPAALGGRDGRAPDGSLTPRALEKMIWERTNLPTSDDRSQPNGIAYLFDRVREDESVLWQLRADLKSEKARADSLAQELRTTQDALADVLHRMDALEESPRGSRLRSLLR